MDGVQRIAKSDRQDHSAIYVRRLLETDETARPEMCPRQDVVAHNVWVAAIGVDNDFLSHGRRSSRPIYVAR
jgi:hypothetical protein